MCVSTGFSSHLKKSNLKVEKKNYGKKGSSFTSWCEAFDLPIWNGLCFKRKLPPNMVVMSLKRFLGRV